MVSQNIFFPWNMAAGSLPFARYALAALFIIRGRKTILNFRGRIMSQQNQSKQNSKQPTITPEVFSDTQSEDLQHARQIRRQPFCWQEKKVLRLIQKSFTGLKRAKTLLLYTTLTWLDNDFNGQPIRNYNNTLAGRSGLDPHWIPKGIKYLIEMKIMLSGGLFKRAEGLWQEIGADMFAPTAAQAVKIAANADQLPPPQPGRSVNRRRKRR